jgi:hypothetical protein
MEAISGISRWSEPVGETLMAGRDDVITLYGDGKEH